MTGETDLAILLQNMKPELNSGEYVYCLVNSFEQAAALNPLGIFQEKEGVTVILPKEHAATASLHCSSAQAWITLTVHSSLAAVGLTAAFSKALTQENISCNVVAGFYHDHIFIPVSDAQRAMDVLSSLTGEKNEPETGR